MPQTPSTAVDTDQITTFHELVYANYAWPEGALVGVCSAPAQGRGFRLDAQVAPNDTAHFTRVCSAAANAGRHVWSGVALSRRVSSGRGKAADVLAGAALVLDLDCRPDDDDDESGHKAQALPHPTRSQVEGWVAASPWADELLLVETGGGLQGWLLLTAPLPAAELAVLQERWARMWEASADRHGWAFDAGVSRDLARVLRVPGTRNRKPAYAPDGAPVTLLRPGTRVELAAVDGPLAAWEAKAAAEAEAAKGKRSKGKRPPRRTAADTPATDEVDTDEVDDRPGTRLALACDIREVWCGVHGGTVDDSGLWYADDADGHNQGAFYAGDVGEPWTMTMFSEWWLSELGVDRLAGWTSWDLLAHAAGGDFGLAARVARAVLEAGGDDPTDELIDVLRTYNSPELLASAFPRPVPAADSQSPISIGDGCWVVMAGPGRGLWQPAPKNADDNAGPRRIVDWTGRQLAVHESTKIDEAGRPKPVNDFATPPTVDIELASPDGTWIARGVPATHASSPRAVLDAAGAPLVLPTSPAGRAHLENMLRVLGSKLGVARERAWTSGGWVRLGEHWTCLAPAGAVDATGPLGPAQVVGPPGSDVTGLNACERRTGWPEAPAPEEVTEEDWKAVAEFVKVLPGRPDATLAALGALFAAPLGLRRRTTVFYACPHGSGKTVWLSRIRAWSSSVVEHDAFNVAIRTASPARAAQALALARDCVTLADDYRRTENDPVANSRMDTVLDLVSVMAYGGAAPERSTSTGGMRGVSEARTIAIATGETAPTSPAVLDRMVVIELAPGDIPLDGDPSPLDAWLTRFGATGVARRLAGAFRRHLAGELDLAGDDAWEQMTSSVETTRLALFRHLGGGRAAEHAAVLGVGLGALWGFARATGHAHLLPDFEEEVLPVLRKMVAATREAHREGDTLETLLGAIRGAIATGEVHLTSASGSGEPTSSHLWGWSPTGRDEAPFMLPRGKAAGRVLDDRQAVLLTAGGVEHIATRSRMAGLSRQQIRQAMDSIAIAGGHNKQIPYSMESTRPRGWVVPITTLFPSDPGDGGSPVPAEPAPAPAPAPAEPPEPTRDPEPSEPDRDASPAPAEHAATLAAAATLSAEDLLDIGAQLAAALGLRSPFVLRRSAPLDARLEAALDAYAAWVATRVAARGEGGKDALLTWAVEHREVYRPALDEYATAATGWRMARDWARAIGCDGMLPSDEDVAAAADEMTAF